MKIDKIKIGKKIKSIRINQKENAEDFGKRFDPPASQSLVSRWERGVNLPNNARLKAIADIAGISVDELLNDQEQDLNQLLQDVLAENQRLISELKLLKQKSQKN